MELIDLDTYKEHKGIKSDKDDESLEAIIASVSSYVKGHCGRTFIDYAGEDKVEYFDAYNESKVYLIESPLVEVVSVELSVDFWDTSALLLEKVDYIIGKKDAIIRSVNGLPFSRLNHYNTNYTHMYQDQEETLKVVYKGGYTQLPEDLKLACVSLVEYFYKQDYTPVKSLGSNRVENSLGYISEDRLPGHIARTLAMYRWIE